MHTRTTGVVAAMISLGAGLILTPAASATTEVESTTAPTIVAEDASGVVIARDETFRLRAVRAFHEQSPSPPDLAHVSPLRPKERNPRRP